MLYLLHTANIAEIERAFEFYPMVGVTTNPTIISKERRGPLEILTGIRKVIGDDKMLHAQVVSKKAEEMVKEAEHLTRAVGGNLYIEVPVISESIKVIKILKSKGMKITATSIFTAEQALMAAVAGADFVVPYINQINHIGGNGVKVVDEIIQLFHLNNIHTKVLASSFRNIQQVHNVALAGAQSVSVNLGIMEDLLSHPFTDWNSERFIKDWELVYGIGKLIYHL